ncbi:MAG: ABC transporter ATP-binding protein [Oscillospiraceae bacterium]|nr:ABC transporter ATP-binding protein [Oscillospiraceae bacterium]
MIEVKNLVKRYGAHTAVNDLSFTVQKGQIYGFLGPNGAGKSTTMNIMTGYLAPTAGEVIIDGHNILEEPEAAKKCVGYLPELPPLYADMTVTEYLQFVAELKKIPKAERESSIDKVITLTKLEEVQARLIRNLSKGYKQRVGLAMAVLGFPPVIILDEPTVGLDPKQIIEIRDLIRQLAENHTVILSSHILSEVSAVCDHILIISHGKLVASDSPANLEKLFSGARTLTVTVKATQPQLADVLAKLENISQVTYPEPQDGATSAIITTQAEVDIREKLFYACAEAKCPILLMQQAKASLEEVFLELTSEDYEAAASPLVQTQESTDIMQEDTLAKQEADENESNL